MPDAGPEILIWPAMALAWIGVIALAGWWKPKALAQGPLRDVGLGPADLIAGLGATLVGVFLAGIWIGMQASADLERTPASVLLTAQVLQWGPAVAWLLWRTSGRLPSGQSDGWTRAGLWPWRGWKDLGVAGLALLAAVPLTATVILGTQAISQAMGMDIPEVGHDMLARMRESTDLELVLLMVSAVVAAPLLEELVFRGLAQSALASALGRDRRWLAVVVVSLVFVSVHGSSAWQTLPGLFVLSCVLGWLYERTGSLWPSILAHAGFNALNVAVALLADPGSTA